MTAIIAGRLQKANFIVADAMVQLSLKVTSYKECRLHDKISDVDLSEQYLVLAGEQLIADGANLLNHWSVIKKIKFDLFLTKHFKEVLELAKRYRKLHEELGHPIIEQDQTDVYIASRRGIKYYGVKYDPPNFKIISEGIFPIGKIVVNYKGNVSLVSPPKAGEDLIKFGISEICKEHEIRKKGEVEKTPLGYDFENIFSSVVIPQKKSETIQRVYPYKEATDILLAGTTEWDLITDSSFSYSPKI